MGLIDKLLEKAIDLVAEEGKAKRTSARELQILLIERLREYSTEIEALRGSLLSVRDELQRPISLRQLKPARDALEAEGRLDQDDQRYADMLEGDLKALGLDSPDHRAASNLIGLRIHYYLLGESDPLVSASSGAGSAHSNLDEQWSRLRPILDDCVELEAVQALRVARHQMRASVVLLVRALDRLVDEGVNDRRLSIALEATEQVLRITDRWNELITSTRKRFL